MNRWSRLVVSQLMFAALQLILSVVLARALGPEQRGTYAFLLVSALLAALAFELGGEMGAARLSSASSLREVLGNRSLWIASGLAAVAAATAVAVGDASVREGALCAIVSSTSVVATTLRGSTMTVADTTSVVLGRAAPPGVSLAVSLGLIYADALTPASALTAFWVGLLVGLAVNLRVVAGRGPSAAPTVNIDRPLLQIHLGQLGTYGLIRLDQFILGLLADRALLGVYSVAVNLSEVTQYGTVSLAALVATDKTVSRRRIISVALASTVLPALVMLIGGGPIARLLYGDEFAGVTRLLPWLVAAGCAMAAARVLWALLLREGQYARFAIGSMTVLALAVPVYVLFVDSQGALGAARASLLAYIALAMAFARLVVRPPAVGTPTSTPDPMETG